MKTNKEIWKQINLKGFAFRKAYFISNLGRVGSSGIGVDEIKSLKSKDIKGYQAISLHTGSSYKVLFIHRLVAETFCDKSSRSHNFVIHIDHNKKNNQSGNLKWCTQAESNNHIKNTPGKLSLEKRNVLSSGKKGKVLTKKKVEKLKELLFDPNRKLTYKVIAKKFGISEMSLYRIKRGENWYTVRVEDEPKNYKFKLYKKIKKERKSLKKKHETA